jgi:hypothetical protein
MDGKKRDRGRMKQGGKNTFADVFRPLLAFTCISTIKTEFTKHDAMVSTYHPEDCLDPFRCPGERGGAGNCTRAYRVLSRGYS